MRKQLIGRTALAACALLNLLGVAAARAAGAEPDLSTPTKALAFFIKALEKADGADLKAVVTGDEKQQEWARAEAAQWGGLKDLDAALARRFGADYATAGKGKEAKEQIAEVRDDDLHADLLRAKLGETKDDEAEVTLDDTAPANRQGRLVRVGAVWKFDLASLSEYTAPDDVPVLKAVGVASTELARNVAAAKFATIEEAADAIDERITAALESAAKKPAAVEKPAPGRPRSAEDPKGRSRPNVK